MPVDLARFTHCERKNSIDAGRQLLGVQERSVDRRGLNAIAFGRVLHHSNGQDGEQGPNCLLDLRWPLLAYGCFHPWIFYHRQQHKKRGTDKWKAGSKKPLVSGLSVDRLATHSGLIKGHFANKRIQQLVSSTPSSFSSPSPPRSPVLQPPLANG